MTDKDIIEEARQKVNRSWSWRYKDKPTLDDVDITDTPGYWREKKECNYPDCHAPIHSFLFNNKPTRHTLTYLDRNGRDKSGRFTSPYKTWRILKEASK